MLIELSRSKQKKMINLLLRLAEHPGQLGNYSTQGKDGRSIEHLRLDGFRISFSADDAVRELRVVDIARLT